MEKPSQQGTYVSIFQQLQSQKSQTTGSSSIFSGLMKTQSSDIIQTSSQKSSKKNKKPNLQDLEQSSTTLKKIQTSQDQAPKDECEISQESINNKQTSKQEIKNKIEIVDHAKPRKQTSTRVFQSLLQWLFTKQGINPLWIMIEDRHLIQNFVYITLTVPPDFEKRLLAKQDFPFLGQYYDQKNIAVFKERTVQNEDNYWHSLFQTKLTEDISLPLFNKNTVSPQQQINQEQYQAMTYEEKLYYKYSQFCHSKQTLKNNLYPTESEDFPNYVSSTESTLKFDTVKFENKILGLDCEMVSTEYGLELARISLVNFDGEVLIDQLVKTPNRIINYNTQYSGITQEMLKDVKVDLQQAQKLLFQYVCQDTILIGHSLENDLVAMQVIHNKVIDTSILFLTKNERKLKLKDLAQKFLNCKIQQGSHCPSEDAKSALSLAKLRIEILEKFDNSKIISGTSQITLDLLDQIIKTNNTILILDETDQLMRLLQYGVHYDELKQNSNEQRLDKIVKWVKKKKKENCIIPRIIMTQLIKEKKQMSYKDLDSKFKEIVDNSPQNSVFAFNFEIEDDKSLNNSLNVSNPFCIFVSI
ncbi:exonuclease (macronuclear) [Tetrahymena thermophila SB210]|uniref:Exonuclease n=1 Tax=Tetrahymena thermophila (strain SB210) TaxID=312017 RepID=I7LTR4_TETTS|nr:exonuclease [Tetrahymena thermophila SB210]EAR85711.2 exonuclease [Tetrahymena thermophila SB210]|eukprot:XP_001033374.2 exonuclease [Tetrahymena thermophila SB210]